jgi:hypothetical protein
MALTLVTILASLSLTFTYLIMGVECALEFNTPNVATFVLLVFFWPLVKLYRLVRW